MYERFTDRLRKTLQLANQEAQRYNHEWIGTEHLLLGLVKETTGIHCAMWAGLGIDPRKIRLEVEKRMNTGPEMVTMGKLPMTPAAKAVLEGAMSEAQGLQGNYVGTEHLLLALSAVANMHDQAIACVVLSLLGATYPTLVEELKKLVDVPKQPEPKSTWTGEFITFQVYPSEALITARLVIQTFAVQYGARPLTKEEQNTYISALSILENQMKESNSVKVP